MNNKQTVDLGNYLPSGFIATKSIPVLCGEEDGTFKAYASGIGLLVPGMGETAEEALHDLGEAATEQLEQFLESPKQKRMGPALFCYEQLTAAISRAN
jgi:hypothetical protein